MAMNQQRQVVIADGVVRRPVKPWTPTVQALLTHLYDAGLPVPEPRGFDSAFEYVAWSRAMPARTPGVIS